MLWEIIKKEIRDHLLSLRLMLAFLLVLVVSGANAFMFREDYQRQLRDYSQDVNGNLAALAKRASYSYPLFSAFSYNDQFIYRRPNPLGFVAEGHDKDLPNAFRVSAFRLGAPEFTLRGNPLLWRFDSLDWAFIVSVILSFTAIVLIYDGINGEKQRGTLRLMMSQPVARTQILLAKFLSCMLMLILPLTAGVLLDLLIVGAGGAVPLNAALAWRIAVGFALSALYISIFVLLGLLLSARSRTPVVSLVTGLLAWVFLVIVIPAAGNLIARGLIQIPPQDRVAEDANRAKEQAVENYNNLHPHPDSWIWSNQWSPGESLMRALEADQAWSRVFQAYQDSRMYQVKLGRRIAALSPAGILTESLERVADSGVSHYDDFLKSARRYQQDLAGFLNSKYPLDKVNPVNRNTTDAVVAGMKLDFGAIPKFEDRTAPASQALAPVLGSAAILAFISILLFAATFVSFLRYDVR